MTDPTNSNARSRVLHLAAVGGAAGVLLALAFGLGSLTSSPAEPLAPDERLGEWRYIALDRKQATVRQLLDIWKADGTLAPRVAEQLADPAAEQQIVDELIAGLDLANDHNTPDYIPPGETIRVTARDVVRKRGWDK